MATHLHGTNLNNFGKIQKSTILFHADILFSEKYLNNIIRSNSKNIIGVKKITKKLDKEIYYVSEDKLFVKKKSPEYQT